MTDIQTIVDLALAQAGDVYRLGSVADPNDPDPKEFDCSELVKWSCNRAGVEMPDLAYAQAKYCRDAGFGIPVERAVQEYGALLFCDYGPMGSGGNGNHVAFSLGDGRTIEARSTHYGVGIFTSGNRGWNFAARIPNVEYRPVGSETGTGEEDLLMFRYRDKRYFNGFFVGASGSVHLSATSWNFLETKGIPVVEDVHDECLRALCFQSGMSLSDLTPDPNYKA